jgi:hypothetical protein
MKPPEHVRREKIAPYLAERARRERVRGYLTRVMGSLVQGAIDSAIEARIREKYRLGESGIASITPSEWDFAERTGMVSLRLGVK